jgi:hypothetical protein
MIMWRMIYYRIEGEGLSLSGRFWERDGALNKGGAEGFLEDHW